MPPRSRISPSCDRDHGATDPRRGAVRRSRGSAHQHDPHVPFRDRDRTRRDQWIERYLSSTVPAPSSRFSAEDRRDPRQRRAAESFADSRNARRHPRHRVTVQATERNRHPVDGTHPHVSVRPIARSRAVPEQSAGPIRDGVLIGLAQILVFVPVGQRQAERGMVSALLCAVTSTVQSSEVGLGANRASA